MSILDRLTAVIAPHECLKCGAEGALLCVACGEGLPLAPTQCYRCERSSDDSLTCKSCRKYSALASASVRTPYEGVAKELLYKLKFERAQAAARTIAATLPASLAHENALVTYLPTANARVRSRGYDQTALIARAFARRMGLPCVPLLARLGDGRQVGQNRNARKQQAALMFRPIRAEELKKREIIIIDDVLTTGATCEAAARVLKDAGARQVHAIVFARAYRLS